MPKPLKLYVGGVVVAGVLLLALLVPSLGFGQPLALAFWLLLLVTADFFPVPSSLGGGVVTGASPIAFATVLLFGPGVGALYGTASGLVTDALRRRVGPVKVAFNVAQLVLALGSAGLIYRALGGRPVPGALNSIYRPGLADVIPVLGCYVTYFLLNTGLVSTAIGLSQRTSPLTCWRSNYLWALPQSLSVPAVSFLYVLLYLRVGMIPVVVLFSWQMIFTRSFRIVAELHDSQRRTLAMLASATDAGVPHLKGRSSRVAALGVAIAREMGLSSRRRELVEYAGLLHNVGLLSVDRRLLLKPGPLDEEELMQLQSHVDRGAAILEEVPSLRRVAEVVRAHHERPDGRGYPRGLGDGQIPLESHIVGVAEAFEEMIAESPQHSSLEVQGALDRLSEGAGEIFDRAVVEATGRLVRRGQLAPAKPEGAGRSSP